MSKNSAPPAGDDQALRVPPGPTNLPGWPRALRCEWAAAYVAMAPSTFLREVAEGRAPAPLPRQPGCKLTRWLREHLDRYLDDIAAAAEDPETPNPWDRPVR
jgi:hypothetical protein